jgi:hypothetical protein
MSSFQERFKNRANFIGKQGNIDIGTAYVDKPKDTQVFPHFIKKTELNPPATAFIIPNSGARGIDYVDNNKSPARPARKQARSAKPIRNIKISQSDSKESFKPAPGYSDEFKPYNLKDYQCIKSEKYYQLGGLGPSYVGTEEWNQKKELNEKRMNYGKRVNIANASFNQGTTRKTGDCSEKDLSKVEKAKIFAKNVPKPKMKKKVTQEPPPAMNSVLEELEKQHREYKLNVEAIRSGLKD